MSSASVIKGGVTEDSLVKLRHCSPLRPLAPPLPLPQAFQRLVYVSHLVYGDQKAAFLLPWRRHFTLTEAQLFVARRDNAKAIFRAQFELQGGDLKADR